ANTRNLMPLALGTLNVTVNPGALAVAGPAIKLPAESKAVTEMDFTDAGTCPLGNNAPAAI
ncbi:MAG: hypothetical protein COZ00_13090, partial [Zetaproteobacteria bacterium CG_4_10_14_0_8_um_filter_49_80]